MSQSPQVDELPDDAVCIKCGYLLKNLSKPRCPECGQAFEHGDQWSYRPSSRLSTIARFGMRGPGWLLCAGITCFMLTLLYGASAPGGYFLPQLVGVVGMIIFGGCWVIRAAMCLHYWGRTTKRDRPKRLKIRMTIPIAVFIFGIALLFANATERMRFAFARPGMQAVAAKMHSGQINQPKQWFKISGTRFAEVYPTGRSGTIFFVGNTGVLMIAPGGWIHLPDPADQADALAAPYSPNSDFSGMTIEHFSGDWYRFDN